MISPYRFLFLLSLGLLWSGIESLPAQDKPAAPTNLSELSEQQFFKWLLGTRWDYSEGVERGVMWFASSQVALWKDKDPGPEKNGYGYAINGVGKVSWYRQENERGVMITMSVNEDLKGAVINIKGKMINATLREGRSMPTEPENMDVAAFHEWVRQRPFDGKIVQHHFPEAKKVVLNHNGKVEISEYEIFRTGSITLHTDADYWNRAIIIVTPDLKGFNGFGPFGSWHGSFEGAKESPADGTLGVRALARTQAATNALVVLSLGDSNFAGKCSKLAVTVMNIGEERPTKLSFNQAVGEEMMSATNEVIRFVNMRHKSLPTGHDIQLAFAEQYSPKDGPSAATACALLLESLITGEALDPAFAITGDMNADGTVQPVGGVTAKIRAASTAGMRVVAIPEKNRGSTVDLAVTDGVRPFLGAQILSITSFEQAWDLARTKRPEKLENALTRYKTLADKLRSDPASFRTAPVMQELKEISEAVPNHVSAKLLIAMANGTLTKRLSAVGSMEAVEQHMAEMKGAMATDRVATSALDGRKVKEARVKLTALRSLVDPRVQPFLDAWLEWSVIADQIITRKGTTAQLTKQLKQAETKIGVEIGKLMTNKEFTEQLMQ